MNTGPCITSREEKTNSTETTAFTLLRGSVGYVNQLGAMNCVLLWSFKTPSSDAVQVSSRDSVRPEAIVGSISNAHTVIGYTTKDAVNTQPRRPQTALNNTLILQCNDTIIQFGRDWSFFVDNNSRPHLRAQHLQRSVIGGRHNGVTVPRKAALAGSKQNFNFQVPTPPPFLYLVIRSHPPLPITEKQGAPPTEASQHKSSCAGGTSAPAARNSGRAAMSLDERILAKLRTSAQSYSEEDKITPTAQF